MLATALLVAPVVYHRILFRQHQRVWLVTAGNRSAKAGMVALAATVCGVTWLVFDVVVGRTAGLVVPGLASAGSSCCGGSCRWCCVAAERCRKPAHLHRSRRAPRMEQHCAGGRPGCRDQGSQRAESHGVRRGHRLAA